MNERAFINWLATSGADSQALRDDAFYDPATRQLYTSDILVDGRHFSRTYCSAQDIGWKAASVNLSDIAAMGGIPLYLLVSIVIPANLDLAWLQGLYEGLYSACEKFNARIVGGDTVGGDVFTINVTAIGTCPANAPPAHRWLAQAGDLLLTTGAHGLSQVGLLCFQNDEEGYSLSKEMHRRPQPQLIAGLALSMALPRVAMMDTSDGLADAVIKIAEASHQQIVLNVDRVELHSEVSAYAEAHRLSPLSIALYGGEDFQLLASVAPEAWENCPKELQNMFQIIGYVAEKNALERQQISDEATFGGWLAYPNQVEWTPLEMGKTFQHF